MSDCPKHGPLVIVEDIPVPEDIKDPLRAKKTAPKSLTVGNSNIPKAGCGVFASEPIPRRIRFGPYQGKILPPKLSTSYAWLIRKNGKPDHCVDASEAGCSNWMRYVNCPRPDEDRNLDAFQYKGKIYYKTIKPIEKGEELLVSYGELYERQFAEMEKDQSWKGVSTETTSETKDSTNASNETGRSDCNVKVDSSEVKHVCDQCGGEFLNQGEMNDHLKFHKVSDPLECKSSDKRCNDKLYLQKHSKIHNTPKKHVCAVCDKVFRRKEDLVRHVRSHTGEKPFVCPHCDKGFPGKEHLKRHIRIHTGERPFVCALCDKRFTDRGTLSAHVHAHTGEKPFHCPECFKLFARKQDMQRHLQTHSDEKLFGCNLCEKRFHKKGTLACHMKKHSGLRPHVCTQCDKTFVRAEHLKRHMTCAHSEERQFVCADCNKRFALLEHLKKHMVVHSEVKPHWCSVCNKRFSQSSYLKRHIQTQHGGEIQGSPEENNSDGLSDDDIPRTDLGI